MDAKIKTITITETGNKLDVRMLETPSGTLALAYAIAMQYEETGETFRRWMPAAEYSMEDGWTLAKKLNSAAGVEIVKEFVALFNADIVAWQMAKAMQTLTPDGTLKPEHIALLYSEVAPVELS